MADTRFCGKSAIIWELRRGLFLKHVIQECTALLDEFLPPKGQNLRRTALSNAWDQREETLSDKYKIINHSNYISWVR